MVDSATLNVRQPVPGILKAVQQSLCKTKWLQVGSASKKLNKEVS